MDPSEETAGPMKAYLNDYTSFQKTIERAANAARNAALSKKSSFKVETSKEDGKDLKKEREYQEPENSRMNQMKGKKLERNLPGDTSGKKVVYKRVPAVKVCFIFSFSTFF